jgi:galactose mutarotase-like enzyme
MVVHGFARDAPFDILSLTADSLHLRLTDTPTTRAHFPFSFRLDIEYRLASTCLEVAFLVSNTGQEFLPYALGWHPGFAWPFSNGRRDEYTITFERPERGDVPVIAPGGLFSARSRPVPLNDQTLALTDALFADEALCFLEARSRSLRFVSPSGDAVLMGLENFPHIALWSRPPAPFLCIEAWTGHGDPEAFEGDIQEKPSMRLLPAGAEARHSVRLSYGAVA